jgi:hypothetical protein
MSTNINIMVGDKALLDRAKQQQTANRQAQLQKEATLRLEAEATAAALANQGRDANGDLITGAPFTQPEIDRRPAASRSDPEKVGYFWLQDTGVIVDGLQYQKVILASGDGLQVAEATFENPTISSYLTSTRPTGILPSAPPEWEYSTTGNWGTLLDFLYGVPQSTDIPVEAKSYTKLTGPPGGTLSVPCIPSPDLVEVLDPRYDPPISRSFYPTTKSNKRYAIYPKAASITRYVILPLGKGVALYAQYYVGKARHDYLTIEESTTYTPVSIGLDGKLTVQVASSFSSATTTYSPTEFEECICFIVSRKKVEQITAPPLLLEQFRSLVGTISESTETIYYGIPSDYTNNLPPFNCSFTLSSGTGTIYTFTSSSFIHPVTGISTPGYTFSWDGWSFVRQGEVVFPGGEAPYCEYSEYGLTYEGESDDGFEGGTPLSWYFMDSHEAGISIRDAVTHEDIRAVTSAGINGTVGSKLPYAKYMGLPYDIRTKLPANNVKIYEANGSLISGLLDEANYPYGTSPWGRKSTVKKAGPSPSGLSSIYFIYDWDNPVFCQQQSTRYGITTP